MADDTPNTMQAQLGLLSQQRSFNPVGMATSPVIQYPVTKHPGEISAQVSQQNQMASMQTLQATQVTRAGAMGGMSFNSPLGAFSQQYQSNQAAISANQFNPYYAQMMGGISRGSFAGGGFNSSMMASPSQMTDPSMGIFRQLPQGPMSMVPPTPQLPLIRHPLTPSLPTPMFQTPIDYRTNANRQRGDQIMSAALSTPSIIAHAATDIAGNYAGSALGALLGAKLGGVTGARFGSSIGGIAGIAATEMTGLAGTAGHIMDRINPMRMMSMRGAQMQTISQDFTIGGANLSSNGRGLSSRSAMGLGRMMEDVAYSPGFRKETGFSAQDVTRISRLAGEQGILDMAQTPTQIKSQVVTLSKALKNFMQLASEPSIAEAIKQIGQMRSMGLNTAEALASTQNARMYARMAGTTVSTLTDTAGLQGAMVFQQAGLTAGLGLQMGHGAYGMARQAVASGTYNPQQLAMLGGTSGIAQREMQSNAAFLKMPMIAAAMSQVGTNGTFGLNGSNVNALSRGKVDISQMATMGADNLMAAVAKHGVGALATFQMQQEELQDGLGRALGPIGMKVTKARQVMATQKMLGVTGPGGFILAAKAMGMDDKEARQLSQEMSNPEHFKNLQRQLNVQIQDVRMQDENTRRENAPSLYDRASEGSGGFATGLRDLRFGMQGVGRGFRDIIEGSASVFEDSSASYSNRTLRRTPADLLVTSPLQASAISKLTSADKAKAYNNYTASFRSELEDQGAAVNINGRGYGYSHLGGALSSALGGDYNTLRAVRDAQGGLRSIFGGGGMERVARLATAGAGFDTFDSADEMLRKGNDIRKGTQLVYEGLGSSAGEREDIISSISGSLGGDMGKARVTTNVFARAIADKANQKTSDAGFFGRTGAFTESELRSEFESLKKQGKIGKNVKFEDVAKSSMQKAKGLAHKGSEGAFDMDSMDELSNASRQKDVDALTRGQDKMAHELFGNSGSTNMLLDSFGWVTGSTDRNRRKALDTMYSVGNAKVSTGAALYAASRQGDEAATKKLAELGLTETEDDQARALSEKMDKEGFGQENIKAGNTLGNQSDAVKFMSDRQNAFLASKMSNEKAEEIVGGKRSLSEKGLDRSKSDLAGLEKDMASTFPAAVSTFATASDKMLEAAKRLGTVQPATSLPNLVHE